MKKFLMNETFDLMNKNLYLMNENLYLMNKKIVFDELVFLMNIDTKNQPYPTIS